ncbi:MAG: cobyrinate a,c-diamide synthase [Desulfovibrionaceae bacterium]|nr:cobyrinate a,c-diamide synthase [Desulfovibrionaceae bacterium]
MPINMRVSMGCPHKAQKTMPRQPFHALCLAAPRSGEGKTTIAIALMRLLTRRGWQVQAFKCGPDYIDPSFHADATGRSGATLDTWMMGEAGVQQAWRARAAHADIALCEGVMGLFDGRADGSLAGSTADCARVLGLPVVLVVNARGMAASLAALVAGFALYAAQQGIRIAGVIANNCGSQRHCALLRAALLAHNLPPLLAALPRNAAWHLPERQLGLVPAPEVGRNTVWLDSLADALEAHCDLELLLRLCALPRPQAPKPPAPAPSFKRMAIARDAAFCFYYEENLRALQEAGWELVFFSPLTDKALPPHSDALYFGGGYPEEFAPQLAANTALLQQIREYAQQKGHIYAECGGYMYLARELVTADNKHYALCGLINGTAYMQGRLRSLGYRQGTLCANTFFAEAGAVLRGHEFHWSDMVLHQPYTPLYQHEGKAEGVAFHNIRAGYGHWFWAGHGLPLPCAAPAQHREPASAPALPTQAFAIVLNGASSTGKSSIAQALQQQLQAQGRESLLFSMDTFLQASSAGYSTAVQAHAAHLPVLEALHASISAAAGAGATLIIDHVAGEQEAWLLDLEARLAAMPVCRVAVLCPLEVLEQREAARTDRPPNKTHMRRQYAHIQQFFHPDCLVQTEQHSPQACAVHILESVRHSVAAWQAQPHAERRIKEKA